MIILWAPQALMSSTPVARTLRTLNLCTVSNGGLLMFQARSRTNVSCAAKPSASPRTSSPTCESTRASSRSRAACARRRSSARSTSGGTERRSTPPQRLCPPPPPPTVSPPSEHLLFGEHLKNEIVKFSALCNCLFVQMRILAFQTALCIVLEMDLDF